MDVVVDFDIAHLVPISGWTVAAMAALVGLLAFRATRPPRSRPLRVFALASALAAGTLAAISSSTHVGNARADDPTELSLYSSPARFTIPDRAIFAMVMSGGGYVIPVTNRMEMDIAITGRHFENNSPTNPLLFYSPDIPEMTSCAVGRTLAVGATCHFFVAASASW